jgi:hydrogenase-4 component F
MTQIPWLSVLLGTPLLTAVLAFASRRNGRLATAFHFIGICLLLVFSLTVVTQVALNGAVSAVSDWLHVDALGAIFLALVGVIGFLTGLYSIGYMRHEVADGEIEASRLSAYYGIFQLFLCTMLVAVTANNIIMMWVAIEATTLASAYLVGFYGQRTSLEAAWKYIIICTVGVGFGLYGVILVYSNAASVMGNHEGAAMWTLVLANAKAFDPALMRLAFIFVLIGFGTKAGFFPMHAWLPDAYSEAPSPVSALLSAVLVNCALLVIIRFYIIVSRTLGPAFPQTLLMIFGILSVGVAAFFIISQKNMKRLLAYSSVENMGLIALGFGLGGPLGVLAALMHTVNHSLVKALMFCGAGNVLLKYGTADIGAVKGLVRVLPVTALLFGAGALAMGGMPPFNIFFSEFLIIAAGIQVGFGWVMALCMLLLMLVLAGLLRLVAATLFGAKPDAVAKGGLGYLTLLPMFVLVGLMLVMGINIPRPVTALLQDATKIVLDDTSKAAGAPLALASVPTVIGELNTKPSTGK